MDSILKDRTSDLSSKGIKLKDIPYRIRNISNDLLEQALNNDDVYYIKYLYTRESGIFAGQHTIIYLSILEIPETK